MPEELVPVFRIADAEAAVAWYRRLGFESTGTHQFEPGFPRYVFLERGDVHLHLSEHTGDAPHRSVAYLYVDDVGPISAAFGVSAEDQPWGMRELELTDPDGNRLRIGSRIPG